MNVAESHVEVAPVDSIDSIDSIDSVGSIDSIDLHASRGGRASLADALAYEAPYLIEKLLKERIAETPAEAEALFREVKRFIVLARLDPATGWEMYSLRVDEAWHQFILFTHEYIAFCLRHFDQYVPHAPSNAPAVPGVPAGEPSTFAAFCARYEELFGEPLPDIWYDERSVTVRRRVLNDRAGSLTVRASAEPGLVELATEHGHVILAVSDLARPALELIARTGAFYVRELPGGLADDEKVALAATLVEHGVLRVAP